MNNSSKEEVRKKILNLLRNQKEDERLAKSLIIKSKLFNMSDFQKAEIILFYVSFDGEVDTFEMIKLAQKLGKKVGVPRINKEKKEIIPTLLDQPVESLTEGPYGIKQPMDNKGRVLELHEIGAAILPGVAFDKRNNRLGRGGGYYDRFLKKLPSGVPSIGLAFDFQMIENVPVIDNQDISVSAVITD